MMSKIKNFFYKVWLVIKKVSLKLWQWIKKAYSVCAAFLKENVWAAVLSIVVGILLFILLVQGIVKGIDKINNKKACG